MGREEAAWALSAVRRAQWEIQAAIKGVRAAREDEHERHMHLARAMGALDSVREALSCAARER